MTDSESCIVCLRDWPYCECGEVENEELEDELL